MFSSFLALWPPVVQQFQTTLLPQTIQFAIYLSPIALLVILAVIFADLWIRYVRGKFIVSLKYAVLEIRLPREMSKSPLAMESFLHSLHNTSDGSTYTQVWKGEFRPYYSLELVSIEGTIKFYVWCEDRRKGGVMTALYAQFPGIEVREVEDYTKGVHFDPAVMKVWAAEFVFTKPDPYPIKTYVDYGLDKDPKEEFKVDPLLPLLEFMGSIKPNQQVWIQIPIRAHKKDQRKPGHLWKKTDRWHDEAEAEINKILIRDPKTKGLKKKPGQKDVAFSDLPNLTDGEKEIVKSIGRSVSKLAFDAGIRAIYMSPKDSFDTPFGIGGLIGNLKQFNTEHLNGFRPNGEKWIAQFDHPWQDYHDIRRNRLSKRVIMAYKRRSYFYPPYKSKPIVLNTEELATIYHFPGAVAVTPTLERIPSKRAEAPMNLPV